MALTMLKSSVLAGTAGLALVMATPDDAPAQVRLDIGDFDGYYSDYGDWHGDYDRPRRHGYYRGYSPYYGDFHRGYRRYYAPGVYRERYPHFPGHHQYPHPHGAYQFGPFRIERWH